jgi:beta-glucosidase/6-phospho-beta-glucosidase/beta-galactosidase
VEGGTVNNDWWDFEHDPATAAQQSSIDGIDHFHRYDEDFARRPAGALADPGRPAHEPAL